MRSQPLTAAKNGHDTARHPVITSPLTPQSAGLFLKSAGNGHFFFAVFRSFGFFIGDAVKRRLDKSRKDNAGLRNVARLNYGKLTARLLCGLGRLTSSGRQFITPLLTQDNTSWSPARPADRQSSSRAGREAGRQEGGQATRQTSIPGIVAWYTSPSNWVPTSGPY